MTIFILMGKLLIRSEMVGMKNRSSSLVSMWMKKISSANYIINKAKNFLPKSTLRNLYSSLVHSHINYGLILWGCSRSINHIAKIQKKSIRIINGKSYNYHTEPLFKTSDILKIQDQYKYNVLLFMQHIKHGKLPKSLNNLNYFTNRPQQPQTRQIGLANCTRPRTTYSSLLPHHKFPRIWNELDISSQEIQSISHFKRRIKLLFISKYADVIHCDNIMCKQCYP